VTWKPEPRPEWVLAINRGEVPPIAEIAALPFDRDQLLAEARAHMGLADGGLADFGDDGFVEPLDVLLRALEEEAGLTLTGRWLARQQLMRLLVVRLHILAYVRADPGVRDEVIDRPVFVTGAPRTGTTILHALLAQDPANRVPEGWELLRPVPPPDPATRDRDPRILLADEELRLPQVVVSGIVAMHEYGGRMPKECISAMSWEFRSEEFTARYRVPTYSAWLAACDMRPAYEAHKLVLQILQRRAPTERWVLKSPVHLHNLDALLDVYPDARIAVTHRDPLRVLASVTSFVASLRWAHTDQVDFAEIGAMHAAMYHADLDGLVSRAEAGFLDPERVHHGHYAEFMTDPVDAVGRLYTHFDLPFTDRAQRQMLSYLAARPKDRHGAHEYTFDDLGLDRADTSARFARYAEYFHVPQE
jgi:8-oxo-dGTP pyrophosphatase MutT (NUDIX family)